MPCKAAGLVMILYLLRVLLCWVLVVGLILCLVALSIKSGYGLFSKIAGQKIQEEAFEAVAIKIRMNILTHHNRKMNT